jgi:CHAT domain-containing protein
MPRVLLLIIPALLLGVVSFSRARGPDRCLSARTFTSGDSDEVAAREVVQKLFVAWQKGDLKAYMALWNPASPELAARSELVRWLFAAEADTFANLSVTQAKEDASGHLAVQLSVQATRTNRKSSEARTEQWKFTVVLARAKTETGDAGGWMLFRWAPEAGDLAARVAAANADERQALVDARGELGALELAHALTAEGQSLRDQGRYPQALALFDLARSVAQKAGDAVAVARVLYHTGDVHRRRGDYPAALKAYRECVTVSEAAGARLGSAWALNDLGLVERAQGNFDRAMEAFEQSLKVKDSLGHPEDIIRTLTNISVLRTARGEYPQAVSALERALRLAREVTAKPEMAHAHTNIGSLYRMLGRYEAALENYQKSLSLWAEVGDRVGVTNGLLDVGNVYRLQLEYARALPFFERALALAEKASDRIRAAQTLSNLALLHADNGDLHLALPAARRSLALWEELGHADAIADVVSLIGWIQEHQRDYPAAERTFQDCLARYERLGNASGAAFALNYLGEICRRQRQWDRALAFYDRCLEQATRVGNAEARIYPIENRGTVYQAQGEHAKALAAFQECRALLASLGADAVAGPYARTDFYCLVGIGDVHRAAGRKQEAIEAYSEAIDRLERTRARISSGEEAQRAVLERRVASLADEGKDDVYQSLVSLLVEAGRTGEALSLLERARSKQLLDGVRLSALTAADPNLRALLKKTEQLEQELAAQERTRVAEVAKPADQQDPAKVANLTRLVASTRAELLQVTNRIRASNPDYERFVTIKATDLRAIQQSLPPNVLVVEYLPLESALTVFLVARDGTQARSVAVSRQRIEQLVGAVHAEVKLAARQGGANVREWDWGSDRARRLREALTTLYAYLVAPIRAEWTRAEAVVVVPSGALYYLPFQALAREERVEERKSGRAEAEGRAAGTSTRPLLHSSTPSLRFLVEEKPLSVLTSLDLWLQISGEGRARTSGAAAGRLGAFGNADGSLPGAEQEVKRVGDLFEQSLVYTGPQATRARVESMPAEVKVAHFATHGALNDRDINGCYLALANGEKLKLGEIYGLAGKYPARLTVLSACETALDRQDPGNEVAHLANGFVEAGSTTIMASLWQVADASTAEVMERFYRELKAGKPTAEAKRLAELSLLCQKGFAHPYFWAPFVLIGDWR